MISVVIPTLNEAAELPATLAALEANQRREPVEVIVADGGSSDGTVRLVEAVGARVVIAPRASRAVQLNLGARHARGDVLLFLHADTRLANSALAAIAAALADPAVVGGAFARRFATPSRFLGLTCWLAEWRGRWFGWHLGDQAMFARHQVFASLGGYPDLEILEDLAFSRRLARAGRVVTLRPPVVSSARRFRHRGPVRTTCRDLWWTCRFLCQRPPQ